MKITVPSRIMAGMARKNTCNCGIMRESTPRPTLKTRPNTRNGAEICTAVEKEEVATVIASWAASPLGGIVPAEASGSCQ